MAPSISNAKVPTVPSFLVWITLFGTFLLPPIAVASGAPKLEISDITLPILFVYTITTCFSDALNFVKRHKWMFLMAAAILGIAGISIVMNGRVSQYRDWFEVLKIGKLFSFLLFFGLYLSETNWLRNIKLLFILVLVFNGLHYLNVFDFNAIIEPFYAPKHHLDLFGLNSLGLPATKRMLGTLGNPNNNAILFLLFLAIFLPAKNDGDRSRLLFSILAIVGVIACQSRTAFFVLIVMLIVYPIYARGMWKNALVLFGSSALIFVMFYFFGNSYLESIAHASQLESSGIGRIEQWRRILASMPGHWILGHGVNKAYMEQHSIYAESEYMLYLFRYGIVGVLWLLVFWATSVYRYFGKVTSGRLAMFGAIGIFVLAGVLNSPFSTGKLPILLMAVLAIGITWNERRSEI